MTESGKTSKTVHVVLIETASNQGFVFQSNKLREIVGASGLIHEVGAAWAIKAAAAHGGPTFSGGNTVKDRAEYLVKAPKFGTNGGPSVVIEPVVVTSGKAVFLVDTQERGEEIVRAVTLRALKCAPGLVVRGAVSKALSLDANAACAGKLVRGLFAEVERLRLELEPAEGRFPLHPPVEPCRTTGLPAEARPVNPDGERQARSFAAEVKWQHAIEAVRRARNDLGTGKGDQPDLSDSPEDLLTQGWRAVVHADGNGFGQVFLDLVRYCKGQYCKGERSTARDYFNLYRDLSVSLDLVGVFALREALLKLGTIKGNTIPLVVSVMGGDDLTVICDGANAVAFAEAYLTAFDEAVTLDEIEGFESVIPGLAQQVSGAAAGKAFGAAAGIAIVKPHHPLHRAYDLAEDLTRSAKGLCKAKDTKGKGVSALDFQVIFGDASSSLEDMRAGWEVDNASASIHARPYATSKAKLLTELGKEHRGMAHLKAAIAAIRGRSGDQPDFPRSQQHALREALFDGVATADARLRLVAGRYPGVAWETFGGDRQTLFHAKDGRSRTRLLDAMELADVGAFDPKPDDAGSVEGEQ